MVIMIFLCVGIFFDRLIVGNSLAIACKIAANDFFLFLMTNNVRSKILNRPVAK